MDPIQHPTITLGARKYEVIFRAGDLIAMKKEYGFTLADMQQAALDPVSNMLWLMTMLKIGLRHTAPDLTVDQIAKDLDRSRVSDLASVISAAMGKVLAPVNEALKAPDTVQ